MVAMVALLFCTSANASIITYTANLSGANENAPTPSPGVGFAQVTIDDILNTMQVDVNFSGLTSGNTAAHIHCCVAVGGNAGVATITPTFTGFPTGTTSGTYSHIFDLTQSSTWNPAFISANGGTAASAEAVFLAGIAADQTYLNIHTTNFAGGEIRGFLAVPTPEAEPLVLLAIGILGLAGVYSRRVRG
jgi:hypothetical protein